MVKECFAMEGNTSTDIIGKRLITVTMQISNSMPLHERLKEDHFNLTPSSRMRNGLTEDVLDKLMLLLMMVKRYGNILICTVEEIWQYISILVYR